MPSNAVVTHCFSSCKTQGLAISLVYVGEHRSGKRGGQQTSFDVINVPPSGMHWSVAWMASIRIDCVGLQPEQCMQKF
jgi:hypothetical protein